MPHGRASLLFKSLLSIIMLLVVNLNFDNANANYKSIEKAVNADRVLGEYVVVLKSNDFFSPLSAISTQLGGEVVRKISEESRAVLLRRPMVETASFVLQQLKDNPAVEIAEPNYIYSINQNIPNDQYLGQLWGLINKGQDINGTKGISGVDIGAAEAWLLNQGSHQVTVAVIDTGIDYNHKDLRNNMWVNQAELNGTPGEDDDGNGFVDDIHGYDFANRDGDPMDDNKHGTHCAGTIGAEGNNNYGVVGVAWKAKIMAVKFLTGQGSGSLDHALESIDYATKMNVDIMSNSWGGGGHSDTLLQAIQRAEKKGILFVAAAGNAGMNNDKSPSYPATYEVDNVISVAANDNTGELAYFSNYGRDTVHISAPGVDIYSTTPGDNFEYLSGTSMATPHVSGAAALLLSHIPNLTYQEIKTKLTESVATTINLRNSVKSAGILNINNSLRGIMAPEDPNDPFYWPSRAESISTPHPYTKNYKDSWTVQVVGAQRLSVRFSEFETERSYDKVTFKDGQGKVIATWSGSKSGFFSPVVTGETMIIEFQADDIYHQHGFDIDRVYYNSF